MNIPPHLQHRLAIVPGVTSPLQTLPPELLLMVSETATELYDLDFELRVLTPANKALGLPARTCLAYENGYNWTLATEFFKNNTIDLSEELEWLCDHPELLPSIRKAAKPSSLYTSTPASTVTTRMELCIGGDHLRLQKDEDRLVNHYKDIPAIKHLSKFRGVNVKFVRSFDFTRDVKAQQAWLGQCMSQLKAAPHMVAYEGMATMDDVQTHIEREVAENTIGHPMTRRQPRQPAVYTGMSSLIPIPIPRDTSTQIIPHFKASTSTASPPSQPNTAALNMTTTDIKISAKEATSAASSPLHHRALDLPTPGQYSPQEQASRTVAATANLEGLAANQVRAEHCALSHRAHMTDAEVFALIDKAMPYLAPQVRREVSKPGLFEKLFAAALDDTVVLDAQTEREMKEKWVRE
ncbi:hypothetical protein CC86DRAFT_472660 [Ophiobolus disseminans]|uniref:Uncharacterized protein n=1 Tax=Ophiobolus disseminans TaxID=1469910 RepID=A0A6A6ZER2_9PLEO|nr:hypothetical protein CC86DRAFT_472660 [Ophiobolus disseminans]